MKDEKCVLNNINEDTMQRGQDQLMLIESGPILCTHLPFYFFYSIQTSHGTLIHPLFHSHMLLTLTFQFYKTPFQPLLDFNMSLYIKEVWSPFLLLAISWS